MKKFLFLLLFVVLFSCPATAGTSDYVKGEVLVVLNAPNASAYSGMGAFSATAYSQAVLNQAEAFASEQGFEALNVFSEIAGVSGKNIIRLRSEYMSTDELIQELSSVEGVLSVSPNYIIRLDDSLADQALAKQYQAYNSGRIPNDTFYSQLWGMDNIGMPLVWERFTGNSNVVVAVLDSGIDYNHPDINANMARDSYGNYGRRIVGGVQSGNPMDTYGHGTHVAGTIGAVGNNNIGVVGVNWTVRMLAVNVLPSGSGTDVDIIAGINYIVSEKNKGLNIRVVNMSFGRNGSPESNNTPMGTAIKSLSDAGIICAISAGNDGINLNTSSLKSYPACYKFDNTITVGAIASNNQRSIWNSSRSSNYGSQWVEIGAPGSSIYSTTPNNTYESYGGTSMAAPHVAGAAALLFAAYPNETAQQIKARILSRAKNFGVAESHWKNGTLDVAGAYGIPVITTSTLPNGAVGTAYNQTLTATGNTPIAWSISSGSLPTSLSLNATTGAITGTPTTAGTFNFTVNATNSLGIATRALSIVINSNAVAPTITTSTLPAGTVGQTYNQTLAATGTAPITWSIASGSLPTGLSLNSSGVISGTPSAAGTFNFTVRATNTAGNTTRALSIVINSAPVAPTITTTTLPAGTVGQAYNQTLAATGTTPIIWSIASNNLPNGLYLNGSGVISGTPSVAGTFNFTVMATNTAGSTTSALSIVINSAAVAPTITTSTLPAGTVGQTYNQTLAATGTTPITWSISIGSLPTGLSLNGNTGAISGTPTAAGTFNFTARAANTAGNATRALSIVINSAPVAPTITTSALSAGTVGQTYNQTLAATGTAPITWSIASGSLPTGLNLNASGVISGTPSATGTFNFTVRAANTIGNTTRALSIVINSAAVAPTITTSALPGGIAGRIYNQTLAATGTAPITWSITSGKLPAGLNLQASTGMITGTPTAIGTFSFSVRATNAAGNSSRNLSIVITAFPVITTTSLSAGTVGKNYNQSLKATGTTPIAWSISVGTLPSGLSLNASSGTITGTPITMGTFSFTLSATNSAGTDTKDLSITITAAPTINTSSLPGGNVGRAYSQTLNATGTTPITWSINGGKLPAGLSLNASTGAITGTPTATGTFSFTAKATNSVGNTSKNLSIIITQ